MRRTGSVGGAHLSWNRAGVWLALGRTGLSGEGQGTGPRAECTWGWWGVHRVWVHELGLGFGLWVGVQRRRLWAVGLGLGAWGPHPGDGDRRRRRCNEFAPGAQWKIAVLHSLAWGVRMSGLCMCCALWRAAWSRTCLQRASVRVVMPHGEKKLMWTLHDGRCVIRSVVTWRCCSGAVALVARAPQC